MLHLEKTSNNQIKIRVRTVDPFLKKPFLKAFTLALSFHVFALLLFHITPFKTGFYDSVLPPVEVAADLEKPGDAMIMAEAQGEMPLGHFSIEPPPSLPKLPALLATTLERKLEYIKEVGVLSNPFATIERDVYEPDFTSKIDTELDPITLVFSGNLASEQLLNDPIASRPLSKKEGRIVYSVLLEQQTGKICWLEPKGEVFDSDLYSEGEKILLALRFQPQPRSFICDGDIEIHFRENGQSIGGQIR